MHTIKTLYPDYFQKSRSFLYPLLAIRRNARFLPLDTYVGWQNVYEPSQNKLIVTYEAQPEGSMRGWRAFQNEVLLKHPFFHKLCLTENESVLACVFDLTLFRSDMQAFLAGRYSLLSARAKTRIREHFGIGSTEWAYMETYISPTRHFEHYANLLDIDVRVLKAGGELCDPYNPERELFSIPQRQTLAKAAGIL